MRYARDVHIDSIETASPTTSVLGCEEYLAGTGGVFPILRGFGRAGTARCVVVRRQREDRRSLIQ
jgi:hypothetical protein